jgi:ubiquinone/menaquinone biosynthesis C-methylase UbiE
MGTRAQVEARLSQLESTGWIGDEMIRHLPAGSAVLSVGEGCGEMLVRLASAFPRVKFVGTDISRDRVEMATALKQDRGLDNAWFCVADATCLPFGADAFEAGYVRGVLHVLPSPEAALLELRRVLRSRLLVDRLANRPFFAIWSWLLQQFENVRAVMQHRPSDHGIWQSVLETLQTGTYWPLWRYRVWFQQDRSARVRAKSLLIWERPRHLPVIGWVGIAGSIDVHL